MIPFKTFIYCTHFKFPYLPPAKNGKPSKYFLPKYPLVCSFNKHR